MQSVSRRRGGRAGLLALALVLVAPALASAQLFPDLPIRRERTPCDQENPQFRHIRQEYWGYYPTCWRKFPPGWGCPSPEAPNWEADKKRQKVDFGDQGDLPSTGRRPRASSDEDMTPVKPQGELPALPPDRGSLFGTDPKAPASQPNSDPNPPPGGSARSGAAQPGNAPLGSTDGTPTASNGNPRRGRGFISGLIGNNRQ